MRWCRACGRDIEEHMVVGKRLTLAARGRVPGHLDKVYQCDVKAITNDTAFEFYAGKSPARRGRLGNWVPGKRRVPDSMQRTARNPARYIHVDALQAIARREQDA